MEKNKVCKRCNENKEITKFSKESGEGYDWYRGICKSCRNKDRYSAKGYRESVRKSNKKKAEALREKYIRDIEKEIELIFSKDTEKEVWKYIPNFGGKYQASSLGRIRTMSIIYQQEANLVKVKHYFVKLKIDRHGYQSATLTDLNGVNHNRGVHRWVMYAFEGESNLTVNHINMIKTDNRRCNLEYLSSSDNIREAVIVRKNKKENRFTTDLIGSYLHKGRYCSTLTINRIQYNTGSFDTAVEAHDSYMFYLNRYKETGELPNYVNKNMTSIHDGIDFHKASNKWRVRIKEIDKPYIGVFETEEIALRVKNLCDYLLSKKINIDGKLKTKIKLKFK